jgi:hypothetical protein
VRLNDHVADVNAHTENQTPVLWVTECKFTNLILEIRSGSHRFDGARELS